MKIEEWIERVAYRYCHNEDAKVVLKEEYEKVHKESQKSLIR